MPDYCAYVPDQPSCQQFDPLNDAFNGLISWLIGLDSVTFWELVGAGVVMLLLVWLLSRWSARLYVYTR